MTDEEKRLVRNTQRRDHYHNWGGKEKAKSYYWGHTEKCLARSGMYYQAHREQCLEYQKQYAAEHRDRINAQRRARYWLNHDRELARMKAYRERKKAERLLFALKEAE